MGVLYPHQRDDPIFYAKKVIPNSTWYFNNRLHAGVLGCMDRTMYYNPDKPEGIANLAWLDPNDPSIQEQAVQYMLNLALVRSNTGDSTRLRKAEALDAQAKVASAYTIELVREQWKLEARQLFETSLARTQLALRDATRSRADLAIPDEVDVLPERLRKLCGMYKFRSTGWRNVSVSHLVGILVCAALIFICGITNDEGHLRIEKNAGSKLVKTMGSFLIWAVVGIARSIKCVLVGAVVGVWKLMVKAWDALSDRPTRAPTLPFQRRRQRPRQRR